MSPRIKATNHAFTGSTRWQWHVGHLARIGKSPARDFHIWVVLKHPVIAPRLLDHLGRVDGLQPLLYGFVDSGTGSGHTGDERNAHFIELVDGQPGQ